MFESSGKVEENANGKYGVGYGFSWVAHNAMLSYFVAWQREMRWRIFGDTEDEQTAARIHNFRKEFIP